MKDHEWAKFPNFSKEEFECSHCSKEQMDPEFLADLQELREELGHPIVISSGYRCPEYNNEISSTGFDGPHTTGKAADILISYDTARTALEPIVYLFPGIGVNQRGAPGRRFIHVDSLGHRLWTY